MPLPPEDGPPDHTADGVRRSDPKGKCAEGASDADARKSVVRDGCDLVRKGLRAYIRMWYFKDKDGNCHCPCTKVCGAVKEAKKKVWALGRKSALFLVRDGNRRVLPLMHVEEQEE